MTTNRIEKPLTPGIQKWVLNQLREDLTFSRPLKDGKEDKSVPLIASYGRLWNPISQEIIDQSEVKEVPRWSQPILNLMLRDKAKKYNTLLVIWTDKDTDLTLANLPGPAYILGIGSTLVSPERKFDRSGYLIEMKKKDTLKLNPLVLLDHPPELELKKDGRANLIWMNLPRLEVETEEDEEVPEEEEENEEQVIEI